MDIKDFLLGFFTGVNFIVVIYLINFVLLVHPIVKIMVNLAVFFIFLMSAFVLYQ